MKKILLQASYQEELIEAGCDEAGRGCLAGPVFAAAVILPKGFSHPELNDSKQLSEKQREELRTVIEDRALAFAVASIDNNEIDHINILKASFKAMHLAIEKLEIRPRFLLIDGNRFIKYKRIPHQCIIKGDATFMSIAAASILAKTYRDDLMKRLHDEFPQYGWINNKGYGTEAHRKAIEQYGLSKYHRKSFRLITRQEELF
ncbi:MAG: ribonuclease HII [Chitinophagales bacterium]|nr:ribonuclease HII [Chitinophagales bacterium]